MTEKEWHEKVIDREISVGDKLYFFKRSWARDKDKHIYCDTIIGETPQRWKTENNGLFHKDTLKPVGWHETCESAMKYFNGIEDAYQSYKKHCELTQEICGLLPGASHDILRKIVDILCVDCRDEKEKETEE